MVLKLSASGLLHKTEVGGVVTQIKDKDELQKAFEMLTEKKLGNVQIQKEIEGGVEMIAGVKRDSIFGTVVLFGAGGKMAELIADRNLHLWPINSTEAEKMIRTSKVGKLLTGFRGDKAYDLKPLAEILMKMAKMVEEIPEIVETEINPIKINHEGVWALDAKVMLEPEKEKPKPMSFKKARCQEYKILSDKFREVLFETEEKFDYVPGQYINIRVAEKRINAYSVAYQTGAKQFGLLIDISPGGPGSQFFEKMTAGQEIEFIGPFGLFTFKEVDGAEELAFLGTGSGCSPLRSMIGELLEKRNFKGKISFYAGFRHESDIFWQKYFEELAKKFSNFKYKVFVSQPESEWKGELGRLTAALAKDFSDPKKLGVYICGNKPMMVESRKILTELGTPNERIYEEKY